MAKDITKTPVKLYAQVARGLASRFKQQIEDHGLTFAVNSALATYLRSLGLSIGELDTPTRKMEKAQERRWRIAKAEQKEAEREAEARRQARREREAKRKAEQSASPSVIGETEIDCEPVEFI